MYWTTAAKSSSLRFSFGILASGIFDYVLLAGTSIDECSLRFRSVPLRR